MENENRKTIYKLFAKLFYYPDKELVDLLFERIISDFISTLRLKSVDNFNKWLETYDTKENLLEDLQVEYTQLFITNFPAVPAPICKSVYEERELIGKSTEEIIDFYNAHNFAVSDEMTEPADHIAIELEFIYRLIEDNAPIEDQINFIKNYILTWIDKFAKNINDNSSLMFYSFLIEIIIDYLNIDILQHDTKLTGAEK